MTTITEHPPTSVKPAGAEPDWHRSASVAGLAFVALSVASTFLPGTPPASDDSAAKVAAYFRDNASGIKAAQFIGGLGVIALVYWFGSLWRLLTRAEDGRPRLTAVAGLSLGIALSLAVVSGTFTAAAALRVDTVGEGTQLLWTLSLVAIAGASFGLAAFLGSVTALGHRTRVLPTWCNFISGAAALLFVAGSTAVTTDSNPVNLLNIAAFLVWCVWIVSVSVVLWQRTPAIDR